MSRAAQRQAYDLVPETCPQVDLALMIAGDAVKKQTGLLRAALVDALEDNIQLNRKIEELEDDNRRKNSRIADLEYELTEAQRRSEGGY